MNIQWLVPSQIEAVTRPSLHTHKQRKIMELAVPISADAITNVTREGCRGLSVHSLRSGRNIAASPLSACGTLPVRSSLSPTDRLPNKLRLTVWFDALFDDFVCAVGQCLSSSCWHAEIEYTVLLKDSLYWTHDYGLESLVPPIEGVDCNELRIVTGRWEVS